MTPWHPGMFCQQKGQNGQVDQDCRFDFQYFVQFGPSQVTQNTAVKDDKILTCY